MGLVDQQWIKIAPHEVKLEGGAGKQWEWTDEKAERAKNDFGERCLNWELGELEAPLEVQADQRAWK